MESSVDGGRQCCLCPTVFGGRHDQPLGRDMGCDSGPDSVVADWSVAE